ncbi:MAG: hypothetical protein GX295_02505 [Syntrophomonadaceae bacterium]|nr:hypothetical protein [Syntrophomonadaceae bacterium]
MTAYFEINKKGINFVFTNGYLNQQDRLVYAWKAPGLIENYHDPQGLFYDAEYDPERRAIIMQEKFDFRGIMAKGVGLEGAVGEKIDRYYQFLLSKRLKTIEKLAEAVVRGKISVNFSLVGSNSAHYQPWLHGLRKHDLPDQETRVLAEAIRCAYARAGVEVSFSDPIDFLEGHLNQSITSTEYMHPKAFNLTFDSEIQAYYGYEKEIVTGFDIKLLDIISQVILEEIEKKEAVRQRAEAIAFKQCRECGHFLIVGKYDETGENIVHLPMSEWKAAQSAFEQARMRQLEDILAGVEKDLSAYMETEGFKMAVVGAFYCGC